MRGTDLQKQRGLTGANKTDPVVYADTLKREFFRSGFSNLLQLILRHNGVRFVLDSINLPAVLHLPNNSEELDNRTAGPIHFLIRQTFERV